MIPHKKHYCWFYKGDKPKLAKKKVLFLITNLSHGGAERVLVNLVNNIDKEKFDVTVMTIFDTGINKQYLSPDINYRYIFPKMFHGIKFITGMCPAKVLHRLFIRGQYDIEVAYLEGPPAKIISGCSNPHTKKVAWIHIEFKTADAFVIGFNSKSDAITSYKKFDRIVCVAESVKKCFESVSGISNKLDVKYNTNETKLIREKSMEQVDDFKFFGNYFTICSVAKVENSKGYDRLLEVHKRLIDNGFVFRTIILGIGSQIEQLNEKAKEYGVSDSFIMLGFRENPYKYVSKSDLYICSSRIEGFSTAVTEALILGIPVVSTECSGAKELLGENNEYGIVVDNSEEGIYEGLKKMLSSPDLLKHYKKQAEIRGGFFSKEKTVRAVEDMLDSL